MTAKKIITTGMLFTRLTAIVEVSPDIWLCKCSCGSDKISPRKNLVKGYTKSCGCLLKENGRKHGHSPQAGKSKTYTAWRSMMQRCYRPKELSYKRYGAMGISVCERWHSFENFLHDIGEVPIGLTLDRKDSKGNYEPNNCRWATTLVQNRNRCITRNIPYRGEVKTLMEWSEIFGIKYNCLRKRLSEGWDVEVALTTPTMNIYQISALGTKERWGSSSLQKAQEP